MIVTKETLAKDILIAFCSNPSVVSAASLQNKSINLIPALSSALAENLLEISKKGFKQDRTNIFLEIATERHNQDAKFGEQNHSPAKWLMILGEEVGEVNKAALEAEFQHKDLSEYRNELIQVAAVAIAMIECLDREPKNPYACENPKNAKPKSFDVETTPSNNEENTYQGPPPF